MDKPDNNINNSNKKKAGNNANKAGNNANKAGNNSNKAGNNSNKAGNNSNKAGNNANKAGNNANKAGNNANKAGNNSNKAGNNANKAGNNSNKAGNNFLNLISETNNKNSINNVNLDLTSEQLKELNKNTSNAINRNNNTLVEDIKDKTKEIGAKTKELSKQAKDATKKITSKIENKVRKVLKKDKNDNENKPKTKRQIRKERRKMKRELKEKRREELGEPIYNINKIIAIIFITIILVALLYLFLYIYKTYINDDIGGVILINKPKDTRRPIVISQDPSNPNHLPINRSYNKKGGAQFSYSFWMTINDLNYNKGKMKHIFHKGNKSGTPNQNPGVWIHSNKNTLRINLNVLKPNIGKTNLTSADIYEYVDIENIPLRKYVNITFVFVEQRKSLKDGKLFINCFDVYVNGLLKVRKELSSVPVFNDNDLWVNLHGGFDGIIAQLKYFNYYLKQEDIQKIMKNCPKTANCGIKADCPKYLANDWWFS